MVQPRVRSSPFQFPHLPLIGHLLHFPKITDRSLVELDIVFTAWRVASIRNNKYRNCRLTVQLLRSLTSKKHCGTINTRTTPTPFICSFRTFIAFAPDIFSTFIRTLIHLFLQSEPYLTRQQSPKYYSLPLITECPSVSMCKNCNLIALNFHNGLPLQLPFSCDTLLLLLMGHP